MTGRHGSDAHGGRGRTRRQVLAATLGAAGMVGLAGCGGGDGGDGGGGGTATSTPDSGVTIGLSIPTTGAYLNEGKQMQYGYELAAANLNAGAGFANSAVFQEGLGGGILGEEVELAVENTASTRDGARQSAETLLADGADAFMGAGSVQEALAHHSVATEQQTIYMGGFAPSTTVSEECSKYGFNEMYNAKLAGQALAPSLRNAFGLKKSYVSVFPNSDTGKDFSRSIQLALDERTNWRQTAAESTRVGTDDYTTPIQNAVDVGADVLIFCYYGLAGASVLRQAEDIVPDDMGVVVPLFNRPMARNAGGALEGVVGTAHWDPVLENEATSVFVDAWQATADSDGRSPNPSGLAHLAYVQLFQYAAAAERAGSLAADDVVSELEGHTYTAGLGEEETLRACDHQATRPVPVFRGLPEAEQSEGRYYDYVGMPTSIGYDCDESPASECSFGE